ncbi:MAG: alpha/beta hydrolase [Thaumarchaeota archaeon]|nr:alpha/beta hydrolase [Nitrososphaerota archaeon]
MRGAVIENREVTWNVLDIPVHGTITGPSDKVARSAVIFVAGSGPTDRNWCSPLLPGTNGSAKLLAEALAGQGFLTLRYDKLGSGPHVKDNLSKFVGRLSMQSHMDELAGAVETLVSEKNVSRDSLFVLTSSEGAIHAVNYQLQAKTYRFRGLVLTGAPGRVIGEVARSQIFNQIRSLPDAGNLMKSYDEAVAEFLADEPMVMGPSLPDGIRRLLRSLENPYNLPFARELWAYDLPEHISGVSEPMLVVIGKKDIQTDWKIDGGTLESATAQKTAASFAYPENANHVLKHEEIPFEKLTAEYVGSHYNAPDAELDAEAAHAIFKWLDERRNDQAA